MRAWASTRTATHRGEGPSASHEYARASEPTRAAGEVRTLQRYATCSDSRNSYPRARIRRGDDDLVDVPPSSRQMHNSARASSTSQSGNQASIISTLSTRHATTTPHLHLTVPCSQRQGLCALSRTTPGPTTDHISPALLVYPFLAIDSPSHQHQQTGCMPDVPVHQPSSHASIPRARHRSPAPCERCTYCMNPHLTTDQSLCTEKEDADPSNT